MIVVKIKIVCYCWPVNKWTSLPGCVLKGGEVEHPTTQQLVTQYYLANQNHVIVKPHGMNRIKVQQAGTIRKGKRLIVLC